MLHSALLKLTTYVEHLKALQQDILPQLLRFSTVQQPLSLRNFQFATGVSQNPTLSAAVVDCVNQVQQKLGHGVHPQFCQILVTDEPYGQHLSLAPRYVNEIFGTYGLRPPALIGGAVEGLLGLNPSNLPRSLLGQHFSLRPAQGVSLLAAVLPGVKVYPFHTDSTALPDLPWEELLQIGNPGPQQDHKAAALVLTEPHFTQVPELVSRIQSALPGMPIVGGVVKHGAWGQEYSRRRSMRGALFHGSEALDCGAVGCILSGPLKLESICAQGCRPVGPLFTVTRASSEQHSNLILELDHQPAYLALAEAQKSRLAGRDRLLRLQIGVSVDGGPSCGGGFVQVFPRAGPQGSINIGLAEVQSGSTVQLHVQDPQWAQQELQTLLRNFAGALPQEVRSSPSSLGTFLYSCTGVTHNEPSAVEEALGDKIETLPFQGAKVQGEIGQILSRQPDWSETSPGTSSSLLQSYCSSFGFIRQDSAAAAKQAQADSRP